MGTDRQGTCPKANLPEDVASAMGPSGGGQAGHLSERELVRYWLKEYGIVEPLLEELSGQIGLVQVRAWILYLEHQKRLDDEARRGILINRLRAKDEPPWQYRSWARLLPPVDPTEEFMLERDYQAYCRNGKWSKDVLEVVGEERARLWAEARKRRPKVQQ